MTDPRGQRTGAVVGRAAHLVEGHRAGRPHPLQLVDQLPQPDELATEWLPLGAGYERLREVIHLGPQVQRRW